ncbi:hypothetical protein IWX49DRAFT_156928 [Phyllosticta citricarpa]
MIAFLLFFSSLFPRPLPKTKAVILVLGWIQSVCLSVSVSQSLVFGRPELWFLSSFNVLSVCLWWVIFGDARCLF